MKNEGDIPEPSGNWPSEIKTWIQDNVRIVLSIVIVLVIALGVYSYSKRGAEDAGEKLAEETTEKTDLQKLIEEDSAKLADEEEGDADAEQVAGIEEKTGDEIATGDEVKEAVAEAAEAVEEAPKQEAVVSQTNGSYEVTAASGDSLTTLARSAVSQYLDTHNDSSVTAEHKIYMEDYLAKKMGYSSRLNIGETKAFSESDIESALEASKTLTPGQLDHLKVFSQQVPSL
ncbi:MAG: hypothetical protein U9Q72_03520 [Patescibacteria group bacterium]|nr:hypothetical protein [Patescibacteria group bacterium]